MSPSEGQWVGLPISFGHPGRAEPMCAQELLRFVGGLQESVAYGLCFEPLPGAGRERTLPISFCQEVQKLSLVLA